ncbi:MAG: hypothetical protein KAX19_13015, partial [Candidatus Brocadiae bacterium]|nr:hypothetical protein [Candidatus Brocadiia bacterium]
MPLNVTGARASRANGSGLCVRLLLVLAVALPAALAGLRDTQAAEEWQALIASSGRIQISFGGGQVATVTPGLFEATWRSASVSAGRSSPEGTDLITGRIRAPGRTIVHCELRATPVAGGIRLAYTLTPRSAITLNSLHVSLEFPISQVAGAEFVADGERGKVPIEFESIRVRAGLTESLRLPVRAGSVLRLDFESPTPVLLQDNRTWGPSFTVRIGPQFDEGRAWPAGEALDIVFDLTTEEGIQVEYDRPVTIEAGPDWVPLAVELDIMPGSALDFSAMGQLDPPAGGRGWLIARPDGQFAFEDDPDTPRRFYGVNL